MIMSFSAAVTVTKVFKLTKKREVDLEFYSSNWNSATIKLTVDRGDGVSHSLYPIQDTTTPLVGAEFVIGANWTNPYKLGAGRYGITVTGTPTSPIVMSISDASGGLHRDTNFDTYG